jgi:hypothetical protein
MYNQAEYQKAVDEFAKFKLTLSHTVPAGFFQLLLLIANFTKIANACAGYAMINYMYVNGQGQNVWCRSNKIITDAAFFGAGQVYDDIVQESCLAINLKVKYYYEVIFDQNYCNPEAAVLHNYCMCSD